MRIQLLVLQHMPFLTLMQYVVMQIAGIAAHVPKFLQCSFINWVLYECVKAANQQA